MKAAAQLPMTALFLLAFVGCASSPATPNNVAASSLVRKAAPTDTEYLEEWILVEEDASRAGQLPDGASYTPGARVLVQRRLRREPTQLPASDLEVKVELVNRARANSTVGEQVDALVYVLSGEPHAFYEISVRPTRPCVRISSETHFVVKGRQKIQVGFTSLADGEAGILVSCRRLPSKTGMGAEEKFLDSGAAMTPR